MPSKDLTRQKPFLKGNCLGVPHMKRLKMLVVLLWVQTKDSGLTLGVDDEMPLFLAVKVFFREERIIISANLSSLVY